MLAHDIYGPEGVLHHITLEAIDHEAQRIENVHECYITVNSVAVWVTAMNVSNYGVIGIVGGAERCCQM